MTSVRAWLRRPLAWVPTTYFAEGFPYAAVHNLADVMFAELGASLQAIGLTSLLHLPWNLKFAWGPILDAYGTKRRWIALVEVGLLLCFVGLAVASSANTDFLSVTILFTAMAILAATHDIAIDGYYLEALDEKAQARWVGVRAPAYRAALLLVAGPGLILASRGGFPLTFAAGSATMFALFVYHSLFLPPAETAQKPFAGLLSSQALITGGVVLALGGLVGLVMTGERASAASNWLRQGAPQLWTLLEAMGPSGVILCFLLVFLVAGLAALPFVNRWLTRSESFYAKAFVSFLGKPKVALILWFVVFFRTGESFLQKMRYPFVKSLGMSLEEYGWAKGTLGMLAALVAPAIGGWLIARDGLRRWIWPFVLAQNGLNLAYVALAAWPGRPTTPIMTAAITLEMFGAGLGTAVFMVYLMRCPLPGHRAAHFAILTALMSVSFTLSGILSGVLADYWGYQGYFIFSVVATLPGMLIIPFLPHLDDGQR